MKKRRNKSGEGRPTFCAIWAVETILVFGRMRQQGTMEKVEEAQKWGHWAIREEENGPPPPPQLPLIFGVRGIGSPTNFDAMARNGKEEKASSS
jgi:hypothetical protein